MDVATVLKVLTLGVLAWAGRGFIAADYGPYSRFSPARRSGRGPRLILFHCVYLASAASPFLAPFIENAVARVVFVLYFVLSGAALVAYRSISGTHIDKRYYFDDDVIELLWRERAMARSAFRAYFRHVMPVLAGGVVVTAIFVWPPSPPFAANWPILVIAGGLAGIFVAALTRWRPPLPTIARIPIQLLLHVFRKDLAVHREPAPVAMRAAGPRRFDKIVVVMDESVRGDFLSLADPALDTTPYLASLGDRLIDMGVTVSGHNCSSYSRYIFRFGARAEDLRYQLAGGLYLPGPNIWQYARAAGYRTVYVDGFSTGRWCLHSGMTRSEGSLVDRYVPVTGEVEDCNRDLVVADRLIEALREPGPALIFVDKFGVHNPYDDKYPVGEARFQPAGPSRRDALVAQYRNALRWNVDGFFRKVVPAMDLENTILFYTADHGQSMMDGGYEGSHGRFTPDAAVGEALVPFFMITAAEPLRSELAAAARRCRNRLTHFEIFPVLLAAFGYDRAEIARDYGEGPFGAPPAARRFLIGFKRNASWVPVHDDELAPGARGTPTEEAPAALPANVDVVVVNRARDMERREHMARRLTEIGVAFSLFPAVDAGLGEHLAVSRHDPVDSRRGGGSVLSPGEIGCFASHYALWQRCAAGGRTYVVLEDDVDFVPGFTRQVRTAALIAERGVVRIGFNPTGNRPLEPTMEKIDGERLYRCPMGSTYGTFGYVVSPAQAARLVRGADRWTEPVDHYLENAGKHGVTNFALDVPTLKHKDPAVTPSTIVERRLQRPFTPIELMQIALRRQLQKVMRT